MTNPARAIAETVLKPITFFFFKYYLLRFGLFYRLRDRSSPKTEARLDWYGKSTVVILVDSFSVIITVRVTSSLDDYVEYANT